MSLLNRRQLLASLLLRLQIRLRQTVKKLEARPEIKINVLKSEFESVCAVSVRACKNESFI